MLEDFLELFCFALNSLKRFDFLWNYFEFSGMFELAAKLC